MYGILYLIVVNVIHATFNLPRSSPESHVLCHLSSSSIELILGLFFEGSIVALFLAFPIAIVAAMLLFVSFQLVSFIKDIKGSYKEIGIMLVTAILAILTNRAIGFAVGVVTVDKFIDKCSIL